MCELLFVIVFTTHADILYQILPGYKVWNPSGATKEACSTGAKLNTKQTRYKPSVPVILMGTVRSLGNKMDEPAAPVNTQKEFRKCSAMCFTETWFHLGFSGFQCCYTFLQENTSRDVERSRKKEKERGIAPLIHEKWCNLGRVTVEEGFFQILSCLRPYFLPRELTSAIVVAV